jgi:hypothetical protein
MIDIEEVEEEKETQIERQTGRKGTSDSKLKKTRIEIPGLN